ncbi:MAG: hypothetical protein HY865_03990 [Chloroflexi bacterium]|nr:hypothetical protein [Chloroflexota bacterium]
MSKKVVFNGIEILTNEDDSSAQDILGFVETIVDNLESDLDRDDENFHMSINMDFSPNRSIKHSFSVTNLSNNGTRGKVMRILEKSTDMRKGKALGSMKIDLQVEDI